MTVFILLYILGVLLTLIDNDFRDMVYTNKNEITPEKWVICVLVINLTLLLSLAMMIFNLNKLINYLFGHK